MKKTFIIIFLGLFLISLISAVSITGSTVNELSNNNETQNQTNNSGENQTQAKKIIQTKNRLKIQAQNAECPENCTCSGSVTKCQTQNGREMTIRAGKSGNIIFQVKTQNASTKVELYKSEEGKVHGVFKNNITKEIILPDKIQEKIRKRLQQQNCSCEMELTENGIYQVQSRKRARLFGLFPVKEKVKWEIDAETGEIIKTKTSWWGFLAKDIEKEVEE